MSRSTTICIALILISNSKFLYAQTDSCSCLENIQDLIQKTETNYIAYHLIEKQHPSKAIQYNGHKKNILALAKKTNQEDCIRLMRKFLSYFNDGHLFVGESIQYSKEQLEAFKQNIKTKPVSENEVKSYLDTERSRLDPIEGIWYTGQNTYKMAILRESKASNTFIAVVLQSSNDSWKNGYIKAEIKKGEIGYSAIYYNGNFSKVKYDVSIYKNTIMGMGPFNRFGRIYPKSPAYQEDINETDAALPTIRKIDADNLLITIPSFLIEFPYLDSLIRNNLTLLRSSKNLIVDIRGNTGGNAIYFPLIAQYYTNKYRDPQGLVLSSVETTNYFKRLASFSRKRQAANDTALNFYEVVVKNMTENPGSIVKGSLYPEIIFDSVYKNPARVAILTDKHCASAAESFILHSKGVSNKVTTFGERTYGMIDYTSTHTLKLLCTERGYTFSYPTSTLHQNVVTNGYNKTTLYLMLL
jgi:hypothetical protein